MADICHLCVLPMDPKESVVHTCCMKPAHQECFDRVIHDSLHCPKCVLPDGSPAFLMIPDHMLLAGSYSPQTRYPVFDLCGMDHEVFQIFRNRITAMLQSKNYQLTDVLRMLQAWRAHLVHFKELRQTTDEHTAAYLTCAEQLVNQWQIFKDVV